jgi:hypothetical protein
MWRGIFEFYHPYQQICCGRCHYCRDSTMDQKILRKKRKIEFKHEIENEFKE